MGQTKGAGLIKTDVLTPEQKTLLSQILGQSGNLVNQSAEAFSQYLPGGEGGKAIEQQALNRYRQSILPQIMNAYGSNAKSSSALNQALAASGKDLAGDIQAQLGQMGLQAASGLGGLGTSGQQLGLGTAAFGYQPRQMPFWQQLLLGGIGGAGQIGRGFLGGF